MEKQWGIEEISNIVQVSVIDSGMLALIMLDLDENSNNPLTPLPIDTVKLFLEKNNILFGLDLKLLEQICANPMEYVGGEIEIAKGKEAVNGENSYVEWVVHNRNEKKPRVLEDGKVDFY